MNRLQSAPAITIFLLGAAILMAVAFTNTSKKSAFDEGRVPFTAPPAVKPAAQPLALSEVHPLANLSNPANNKQLSARSNQSVDTSTPATSTEESSKKEASDSGENADVISESLSEAEKLKDFEHFQAYLSSFKSDLLIAADMAARFEAQSTDYEWVSEAEESLALAMYQTLELNEFSPREIRCRESICQIKLDFKNADDNDFLIQLMHEKITSGELDFSYALSTVDEPDKTRYLYLTKNNPWRSSL